MFDDPADDAPRGLDVESAKFVILHMIDWGQHVLGKGLLPEEVTWILDQPTAKVGEVTALLDELVDEGALTRRDHLYRAIPDGGKDLFSP